MCIVGWTFLQVQYQKWVLRSLYTEQKIAPSTVVNEVQWETEQWLPVAWHHKMRSQIPYLDQATDPEEVLNERARVLLVCGEELRNLLHDFSIGIASIRLDELLLQ